MAAPDALTYPLPRVGTDFMSRYGPDREGKPQGTEIDFNKHWKNPIKSNLK
jgi:hypothetical protein